MYFFSTVTYGVFQIQKTILKNHTYSFQYIIPVTTEFHEQSYFPACVTVDSIYLRGKKQKSSNQPTKHKSKTTQLQS